MNIHLIGTYPPPYGGVSVHIYRLRKRLLGAGHECTVWCGHDRADEDLRPFIQAKTVLLGPARSGPETILHFHSSHYLAGRAAAAGHKVLFTVHNPRINLDLKGGKLLREWLRRKVTAHSFRRVHNLIAVSQQAGDELVTFGFDSESISVINAYLRPGNDEATAPANLDAFELFRQKYGLLATANAWALKFLGGEDLYGIDMCLEMLGRLCGDFPELALVLAVPLGRGTEYLGKMQQRARDQGLEERVLWLLEPGAYHPILSRCDLFLRPTNADGFCISIVEAYEFGVPVVASDVVIRPKGCLQFRTRDQDDFTERVREALGDLPTWAARSLAGKEPDHFEEIVSVYRRLADS